GVGRVGDGLTLRRKTDEPLPIIRKRNNRRGCVHAFGVDNDLRLTAFHHGHARVRRSEVNSNHFRHVAIFLSHLRLTARTRSSAPGHAPFPRGVGETVPWSSCSRSSGYISGGDWGCNGSARRVCYKNGELASPVHNGPTCRSVGCCGGGCSLFQVRCASAVGRPV